MLDADGGTALIRASSLGRQEVVHVLLQAGADADCTDKLGKTALVHAFENRHEEVVQLLLYGGADFKDLLGASHSSSSTSSCKRNCKWTV